MQFSIQVSYFLPTKFSEQQVLVYCKNEEGLDDVTNVFKEWKRKKNIPRETDKSDKETQTELDK